MSEEQQFAISLQEAEALRPALKANDKPVSIPGQDGLWWLIRITTQLTPQKGIETTLTAKRAVDAPPAATA